MNSFRTSERSEFKIKRFLSGAIPLRFTVMPRIHRAIGIGFTASVEISQESSAAGSAKETSPVGLLTQDFH